MRGQSSNPESTTGADAVSCDAAPAQPCHNPRSAAPCGRPAGQPLPHRSLVRGQRPLRVALVLPHHLDELGVQRLKLRGRGRGACTARRAATAPRVRRAGGGCYTLITLITHAHAYKVPAPAESGSAGGTQEWEAGQGEGEGVGSMCHSATISARAPPLAAAMSSTWCCCPA